MKIASRLFSDGIPYPLSAILPDDQRTAIVKIPDNAVKEFYSHTARNRPTFLKKDWQIRQIEKHRNQAWKLLISIGIQPKTHKILAQEAALSTRKVYNSMKWLCHNLNSLHVFCRLRSMGFSKKKALRMSTLWEKMVHPGLYGLALRNMVAADRPSGKKRTGLKDH